MSDLHEMAESLARAEHRCAESWIEHRFSAAYAEALAGLSTPFAPQPYQREFAAALRDPKITRVVLKKGAGEV